MADSDFVAALIDPDRASRSALLEALEERGAYVIGEDEDSQDLNAGNIQTIIYKGVIFWFDPADAVTAHDGVTTLVTAEGRRYKADQINGALVRIYSVLDKDLTSPPGSPDEGDAYIVGAAATGDWATEDENIATWTARGWVFSIPNVWDLALVVDEAQFYHYDDGGDWVSGFPALTIADASISMRKLKYFRLGVSVENQSTNAPPGAPADGVAYIVGGAPSGAWVGHSLKVAIWEVSEWVFYTPYEGARVYDKALNALYTHNGATWTTPVPNVEVYLGRLTAAASATLSLGGLSAYKILRIVGCNLRPGTDGASALIRISTDGVTYIATNTYGGIINGNTGAAVASGASGFFLSADTAGASDQVGNAAGDGALDFVATLTSFNEAQKTKAIAHYVFGSEAATMLGGQLFGFQVAQTAMDGFQFLFSPGVITSGTIDLWGTP